MLFQKDMRTQAPWDHVPGADEPQRAEAGESVLRPDLKAPAKSTHHRDRCEDFTMSQQGELSTRAEAGERGRET